MRTTVALRRVLSRSREANVDGTAPLLSLTTQGEVILRSGDDGLGSQAPSNESIPKYLLVRPGQLVVNPMWLVGGSIGVAGRAGAVSPAYRVYDSSSLIEPRYLHHVVRSLPMRVMYQVLARGETTFDRSVNAEDFESLELPVPSLEEQRRIANFLDDRVALIDQIITARREQAELAIESSDGQTSALLEPVPAEGPPLSAVAGIIDTEHKTAPSVPDGGYWIAGTSAIRGGVLVREQLRETDSTSYGEWTARGVPTAGDVLLTREAPVGEVALLRPSDPIVAIGQRVVLLKPRAAELDPRFLRLILMAGEMRRIIALASAGSLHPHLNMAEISRLRIPGIDLALQRELGASHEGILQDTASRVRELRRSIELLSEYKQSLITAAVSGELDVSTAGSGIPG